MLQKRKRYCQYTFSIIKKDTETPNTICVVTCWILKKSMEDNIFQFRSSFHALLGLPFIYGRCLLLRTETHYTDLQNFTFFF